jgi:hypothetical protein
MSGHTYWPNTSTHDSYPPYPPPPYHYYHTTYQQYGVGNTTHHDWAGAGYQQTKETNNQQVYHEHDMTYQQSHLPDHLYKHGVADHLITCEVVSSDQRQDTDEEQTELEQLGRAGRVTNADFFSS